MSDEGDEPPPRPRRNKRPVLLSSGTSSDSDDGGPATSTRRKTLRVISDESSGSSVCDPERRRRRALPALRDSDGDSDGSLWDSDRSTGPKSTGSKRAPKSASGFASDSSEGNSDKCSICLMRFTDQAVGTPQTCEHIFCLDCIMEWSKNVNTCPVDRSTFDAIVVRSRAGGRVLRSQPVQPPQHSPDSMEMFIVDNDICCQVCGGAHSENTLLLCDQCDHAYHMSCLAPPLAQVPADDWYCPRCQQAPVTITVRGGASDVTISSVEPRRRVAAAGPSARRARRAIAAHRHSKRRRKRKTKRRRAQTAARRTHVRVSVRAALAAQRSAAPPSTPAPGPAHHALAVPRLSLFDAPDFDYFSGEDDTVAGPGGAATAAVTTARAPSVARAAHRQVRRKLGAAPTPDLLSDILDSQTRLHSRRSLVSISTDGAVSIELVSRPRRDPAPAPAPGGDARLDPRAATSGGRRRPAHPGQRTTGGWGGGYRYPAGAPPPRAAPDPHHHQPYQHEQQQQGWRGAGGRREHDDGAHSAYEERRPHRYEDERERRRREEQRRHSAPWGPAPRPEPAAPPPQRRSCDAYEAALDMRTAPPPDDDKYDPTEPTHDEDSGDEGPVPPLEPPASLAAVEHMLAADSDDDEDGDCPNFSIYSATSVHIANDPGARAALAEPPPPSGLEDLVQEDGAPDPPRPPPPAPTPPPRSKAHDYNEKVSKRCPITTNTRNPIKIRLNAPSLIRRQVSLYDEEDVDDEPAPDAPADDCVALSPPQEPAHDDRDEEGAAEDAPATVDEPPPADEEHVAPDEVDEPPPPSDPPAAEESPPRESDSPAPPAPEGADDVTDEPVHENGHETDARESCGTPSLPGGGGRRSSLSSADEDERARLDAALEKMTESISETEDERGYTPCLDERRPEPRHPDTELISEDEAFSRRASPRSVAPEPEPERPRDAAPRRKKKKEARKDGRERKRKRAEGADVAFKKARGARDRNYRERDADERRRRDSSDERARDERKKEKRKDLERYDVRTLVSERRRRPKDAFGRDVSPRLSPSPPRASPSPPRRAEPTPRRRRRRSGSRARKRRREPSASPKPKAKKKKRARSSSRSPRRRSAKRKRARRRSGASEPRPPSPRTPPPAPARARPPPVPKHSRVRDAPGPSKEVFTSGDNILVSVSFNEAAGGLSRRLRRRERRRRRLRAAPPEPAPRPVAIIDLERSPFRELTPPHLAVIVLSDEERAPPAPAPPAAPEPAPPAAPEPAPPADEARGPNTPPEPPDSPDAYDPYEPTRSASASPAPAPPAPAPPHAPETREITLETAQKTNMSADEVLDRRPLSPMEKVLALLQSTRDVSPEPPPGGGGVAAAGAEAPRVVLPSPTRAPPPKLFLAKPSPIKSDPIKPMQFRPAASKTARAAARAGAGGGDSPYSPGSSDFGDLFEPPGAAPRRDAFDALVDKPKKKRGAAAKVPVKLNKKKGKTQVDVKIDDASLKIMDELPSSAVEMQVKSKFLKKLNRQERVVEEVKLVLKPHYNKKHVTKDEYKHILRRAVPKICHNKSGEINPAKIQALVEAYVKKFRKKHKLGLA